MRFSDFVIVASLVCMLLLSCDSGFRAYRKLCKEERSVRMEYQSAKFISESFRNTCNGYGFKDLNEWQVSCRQLWGLSYIGWCDSEDFMIDEFKEEGTDLFYGKWIGKFGSGEVYCRSYVQ